MKKDSPSPTGSSDVDRFNQWAATYDRSILQRFIFRPIHSGMLDLIGQVSPANPPASIIDVGCGTGRFLKAASMRWPGAQLYGVDPAENMISRAILLNPDVIFKQASAEALPFPDETADLITSSMSFHHWVDHPKSVREIARVLRPGGWFCLVDHVFLPARLGGDRVQSRAKIKTYMAEAGLTLRRQRWLRIPYILVNLAQK